MLFIQYAVEHPLFYFSWILTVVVSIILHELAHGWAALWQGDDTPRTLKRMTLDPLVHMGHWSLITLLLIGIAWGQMPINPNRFRSRHGEALVAAAGPAMNLLLALLMLTTLGLLENTGALDATPYAGNLSLFMHVFGTANMALAFFNLVPIPPLDGSAILASFHRGYARFIHDPAQQGTIAIMFLLLFVFFGSVLFRLAMNASDNYLTFISQLMN